MKPGVRISILLDFYPTLSGKHLTQSHTIAVFDRNHKYEFYFNRLVFNKIAETSDTQLKLQKT
jgi:hypothetical protein